MVASAASSAARRRSSSDGRDGARPRPRRAGSRCGSCRRSSETRRSGTWRCASRSARPRYLTAFARPRWICMPEWPPRPPSAVTASVTAPSSSGAARLASTRIQVSVLPAQPTVSVPSSSLSRLTRILPSSSEPSRPLAPSSPTSSATVISSCSGPCGATRPRPAPSSRRSRRRRRRRASCRRRSATRRRGSSSIRPSAGSLGLSGLALADHVEMALEHERRRVLAPAAWPARR